MSGSAAVKQGEEAWITQAALFLTGLFLASHAVSRLILCDVYTIKFQIRQVPGESSLCPDIIRASIF